MNDPTWGCAPKAGSKSLSLQPPGRLFAKSASGLGDPKEVRLASTGLLDEDVRM